MAVLHQQTTIDVIDNGRGETFTFTTDALTPTVTQHFNWEELTPRIRDVLTTLNEMFNSNAPPSP